MCETRLAPLQLLAPQKKICDIQLCKIEARYIYGRDESHALGVVVDSRGNADLALLGVHPDLGEISRHIVLLRPRDVFDLDAGHVAWKLVNRDVEVDSEHLILC